MPMPRTVAAGCFTVQERLKGHDSSAQLATLERTQWYSAERLAALQTERLRTFLAAIARDVPFYRARLPEIGIDPATATPTDLSSLPLVDKAFLTAHRADLRSHGPERVVELGTSGSTGTPFRLPVGIARISHDIAARRRANRWFGVDVGDPEAVVWAAPPPASRFKAALGAFRDRLTNSHLVDVARLDDEALDRIVSRLVALSPDQIFGYPSALARVAYHARDRGIDLSALRVKAVFVTSEMLIEPWRTIIGERFGCPVVNEYGARDAGFIARECPAGGFHINAEDIVVEVVDPETGRALDHGHEGPIAITHLKTTAFPLVRYLVGDTGVLAEGPCPCGRGLPRFERLGGRANDWLEATDGSSVPGAAINNAVRRTDGIRSYQVLQRARNEVTVRVVADADFTAEGPASLARDLTALLGRDCRISVETVTSIPPSANGKHRYVVNELAERS